jgi:aminopeptidase N
MSAALQSDGTFRLDRPIPSYLIALAAGDLAARAELGDLSLRANDDVRIDGERVRTNC